MDQPGCDIRPKKTGPDTNEVGPKYSRALRLLSKSLLFAVALLTLPCVYSAATRAAASRGSAASAKIVPALLRNLLEEGLIKRGHTGFISDSSSSDLEFLTDAGIDLLTGASDPKEESPRAFDFVFAADFSRVPSLDRIIKENGLIIAPLGRAPSSSGPHLPSGYKIVYLRRFESTVVAMKKIGATSEEKKAAALRRLEDVYLEPPRREASEASRKIEFLPDLLGDDLDEYPRRVFVSDESRAVDWFYRNYPRKGQEFEVYEVDRNEGVSNWVGENMRREDYVVMKAEAQVVEEMLRGETLCLVDELFLECKNQWVDGEEEEEEEEVNGSKRAYWQCLALYGKIRDQGIAVHQWWD